MRPIFNEKIAEICGSRKQSMGPIDVLKSQILRLLFMNNSHNSVICSWNACKKKKRSKTRKRANVDAETFIQTDTK